MKKILSLLVLVLVVGTFTACARTLKTCDVATLDGTTVCYDEKLKDIDNRFTGVYTEMSNRIVGVYTDMDKRFVDVHRNYDAQIKEVYSRMDRRFDKLPTLFGGKVIKHTIPVPSDVWIPPVDNSVENGGDKSWNLTPPDEQ